MTAQPHFAYPFQFSAAAGATVVDQDSYEDVVSCIGAIVACPVGSCPELPTFGIPDPTFMLAPPDPTPLLIAVQQWEPRADESAVVTALDNSGAGWQVALNATVSGTGQ